MRRILTTEMVRKIWKEEANNLPPGAPPYVKNFAQRILWLIADVEIQQTTLKDIQDLADL